LSMILVH